MAASFYRRPLSNLCVSFSSPEGRELFKRAMQKSHMESYFGLANNFLTQSDPAYCGLGCLAMVLNTLEVDPQRKWKGVWRWYSEEMLDCCKPLDKVKQNGIAFQEFSCLARCNGLDVLRFQAHKTTKDHFLTSVKETCSTVDKVMVVAYARKTLQQTGDGHYSPIGGYDPESNMALVLDVARFKYPSYWVPIDLLWESLFPIDSVTGEPRGYYILERSKSVISLSLLRLEMDWKGWSTFTNKGLCLALQSPEIKNKERVEDVLPIIIRRFYGSLKQLNVRKTPDSTGDTDLERHFSEEVHRLLHQASHHPFYHVIEKAVAELAEDDVITANSQRLQETIKHHLSQKSPGCIADEEVNVRAAMAAIFLLAIPQRIFADLSPKLRDQMMAYKADPNLPDLIRDEVSRIERQMETLSDMESKCSDCNCTYVDLSNASGQ